MRRRLLAIAALALIVPADAAAQATAPSGGRTGGSSFAQQPLAARAFSVAPGTVRSGMPVTVRVRLHGPVRRVRARIALAPAAGGRAVGGIRLGWVRTGRTVRRAWRPLVKPGSYVARLKVSGTLRESARTTYPVVVEAKPKPPPPAEVPTAGGRFPVRGTWTFGEEAARFGAPRGGHRHQGQDIMAAEGTPVVSPVSGTVYWRAVQPGGAGNYLVVRGDDGDDYVFMHLVDGSGMVSEGDPVSEGRQIGQVGSTGRSSAPHLHFEIWPDGWHADGSEPIDPLPILRAWARG